MSNKTKLLESTVKECSQHDRNLRFQKTRKFKKTKENHKFFIDLEVYGHVEKINLVDTEK